MHRRETIQRKENGVTEVEEKRKKKKYGRQVLLAVFLLFAQAIFQRSLYLYTTATSQSVVKHLLHVAVGAVASRRFTPGRRHLMDLRAAKDTTCSLSLSLSLFRTLFTRALYFSCVKKAFPFSPGFHCLWLAVKKERSLAPSAPLHPNPVHSGIHRGPCRGRRWGEGSLSSPFYPVSSHVFLFLSIPRRAVIHISY